MSAGKCKRQIWDKDMWSRSHDCGRPTGFGEDGTLCKLHARVDANRDKSSAEREERYKREREEMARRVVEQTACAGLTDSEVVAMRELWERSKK